MLRKLRAHFKAVVVLLVLLVIMTASATGLYVMYYGKIFPGVQIEGMSVGGMSKTSAIQYLQGSLSVADEIVLEYGEGELRQEFKLQSSLLGAGYDFEESTDRSYKIGRSGSLRADAVTIVETLLKSRNLEAVFNIEGNKLDEYLSVIAEEISIEPVYPSMSLVNGAVVVNPGKEGVEMEAERAKEQIIRNIKRNNITPIKLKTKTVDPSIEEEQRKKAIERAENLVEKKIIAKADNFEYGIGYELLLGLLDPRGGYREDVISELAHEIATKVDREAKNPTFVFDGGRVKEFEPSQNGIKTETERMIYELHRTLLILESEEGAEVAFDIPHKISEPEFSTQDVNNLGIKELVGKGESYFRGSITSRIYNISLASSRLSGILIKPGEEFSFNNALGDVSKLTGYKEAYIIQDGKTILGDGGGVCQVSTTLFRAVLNAGLPIIERRPHSYRVGYYEQGSGPGIDATVYSPTTDFKFKNNTPGHLLIQSKMDSGNHKLVFELYGTSDGRVAEVSKPVITDSTPPPEDAYVDDPSLPTGEVKQIEYKAWGAKVKFDYRVIRGEEEIYSKTFYSNYRPWGAVFLRGTGMAN